MSNQQYPNGQKIYDLVKEVIDVTGPRLPGSEEEKKGAEITALPANSETLHVFHAGTKAVDGKTTVSGGRVLCVVGLGETIQEAAQTAYKGVETVQFEGMQYRHDIGYRAMK